MLLRPCLVLFLSITFLATCRQPDTGPEPSNGRDVTADVTTGDKPAWHKGGMVAAADPRAVEAGLKVLRAGGHAVDAAIAVHAVLGLVEPQSSGIGGGAFMLVFDRESGQIQVFDGRETAPMGVDETLFIDNGEVLDFLSAWQSGRSTGVPGAVALYAKAHAAYGKQSWSRLFDDAITLAEDGFIVSPRLAALLSNERLRTVSRLDDHPASAAYFYPDGVPLAAGTVRDNPDYAATLRQIATEGAGAFYNGAMAAAIVATVAEAPLPGVMTTTDIAAYAVKVRPPLCGQWRAYTLCSAPPPSSGGITQNAIAGLYDRLLPSGADDEVAYLRAFVDAQRLAYADRDHYVADADHVAVPTDDLINPAYLDVRAGEVFAPGANPIPGDPGRVLRNEPIIDRWGQDATEDAPGTTHISIIDSQGNAVSMTATVEAVFGNARMVKGFLLNNELTDFSRQPQKSGLPVANAPGPGKRPRSSMSPTIVFDQAGEVLLVTGSPGGNSIIAYTAKTILAILDWGKSPQEAVGLPNIIARGPAVGVEVSREGGQQVADTLTEMGYTVREGQGENSGLHVILVGEDGLQGGADPRREGVARALD